MQHAQQARIVVAGRCMRRGNRLAQSADGKIRSTRHLKASSKSAEQQRTGDAWRLAFSERGDELMAVRLDLSKCEGSVPQGFRALRVGGAVRFALEHVGKGAESRPALRARCLRKLACGGFVREAQRRLIIASRFHLLT